MHEYQTDELLLDLIHRFSAPFFTAACRLLPDRDRAIDAVFQTFITASHGISLLTEDEEPVVWLGKIFRAQTESFCNTAVFADTIYRTCHISEVQTAEICGCETSEMDPHSFCVESECIPVEDMDGRSIADRILDAIQQDQNRSSPASFLTSFRFTIIAVIVLFLIYFIIRFFS